MPVASPMQIQESLEGVNYPASKEDLIKYAKMNNENDDRTMNVLTQLPDKEYESSADVIEEVERLEA